MAKLPIRCRCGQPAECVPASAIYRNRPDLTGWFWRCEPCGARVGCHPGTRTPLGSLATAEERAWRQAAHEAFDPLWKLDGVPRATAYGLLASYMGLPRSKTHIGMFTVAQCREVIQVMAAIRPANREVA